ncbi:hypothetical protein BDV96DRAFT_351530 [Lophiotrema nucula]|uniref:Uncharacterized protein n=1 Tax=Lophiotrema nucula TaxID=690887 RepID=A0A6A5ZJG5_9PLEO|nr:hypothetical protein BDV96DRAFT_351530 [Lophiotrema nucula]
MVVAEMGRTSSRGRRGERAIDVELGVSRCLRRDDGVRQHVEAFDRVGVAAAARGCRTGEVSHSDVVGEHCEDVRRLRSECRLLPGSRGSCLDGDSPALRICMETTRASLLWQAAAVRPEPERMPSLRRGADSRSCIARVWGWSCFAILTNVAAEAWRDAPSSARILSVALSVGIAEYSLAKTKLRGTDGNAVHYNISKLQIGGKALKNFGAVWSLFEPGPVQLPHGHLCPSTKAYGPSHETVFVPEG